MIACPARMQKCPSSEIAQRKDVSLPFSISLDNPEYDRVFRNDYC